MSATETSETTLLLSLARETFTRQVAKRVRPLARSYVERWMQCEFWLHTSVVRDHRTELHAYKAVVLETLRKTTIEEMLAVCRKTRPDLDDLWTMPAAREKLTKEIARSLEAVAAL